MRPIILIFAAFALVVPATAVAKSVRIKGPAAVIAAGAVKAELKMEEVDGKPFAFRVLRGGIRFTDLGGDLEVRCLRVRQGGGEQGDRKRQRGRGERKDQGERKDRGERRPQARSDEHVTACRGGALARGSHFRVQALAPRVGILVPEGAAAAISAKRLKVRGAGEPAAEQQHDGEAAGDLDEVDESDAIAELEAALAALEGE